VEQLSAKHVAAVCRACHLDTSGCTEKQEFTAALKQFLVFAPPAYCNDGYKSCNLTADPFGTAIEKEGKQRVATLKSQPKWRESTFCDSLVYFHNGFRDQTKDIWNSLEDLMKAPRHNYAKQLQKTSSSFKGLWRILHHHHAIEDSALFPRLHEKCNLDFSVLDSDHKEMDTLHDTAYSLIEKLEGLQSSSADEDLLFEAYKFCLVYVLRRFCHLNISHLRTEEGLTLPLMLELGSFEIF